MPGTSPFVSCLDYLQLLLYLPSICCIDCSFDIICCCFFAIWFSIGLTVGSFVTLSATGLSLLLLLALSHDLLCHPICHCYWVHSLCLVRHLLVSCPIIYSYCCTFRASVVSTAPLISSVAVSFAIRFFNWRNRWFICHIIRNWFISCCYWHCHMIFVPSDMSLLLVRSLCLVHHLW